MRMKLSTIGAATAALALCAVAGAQARPYQPIGASVRVGLFLPTNSSTNDDIGTAFVAFGADYRLVGFKLPRVFGLESYLKGSVDYYRRDDTGNIPVLLNYVGASGQYYFQLGAGVGFETVKDDSKTGFAYTAGVGYNVPSTSRLPIFLQANFFGADRSRVNGFGLFAGIRF